MSDMGEFIPHGQRDLKFLREGHRRGRHFEREAIVAWLRLLALSNTSIAIDAAYIYAANSIESGGHLGAADE